MHVIIEMESPVSLLISTLVFQFFAEKLEGEMCVKQKNVSSENEISQHVRSVNNLRRHSRIDQCRHYHRRRAVCGAIY